MSAVRVAIVDDHALVRAGLRTSLEGAGINVVAEAADGVAAVDAIERAKPDVAVDDEVLAAISAGADAYCVKSSDASIVIDAIRTVAAGGAYFDPRIAYVVLRRIGGSPARPEQSPLTGRETEILKLIADGVGNAEIAQRLHIALGTVKGHVADILDKLSASDRAQAAVTAYRRGLIP